MGGSGPAPEAGQETLRLPRAIATRILAEAQRGAGTEVCGLVGARDGVPVSVYPVPNAAGEPARRFRMDPRGQIEAMRRMREAGETLWAIYHSHPQGPARPSLRDLAEAAHPEAVHLIVSLGTAGVLQLGAWRIAGGEARQLSIAVAED